eukprot:2242624-Amphidinium_carterae.1
MLLHASAGVCWYRFVNSSGRGTVSTTWKPIVLPDGRQIWLHIPTLKTSADPPLAFTPTPESEVTVAICSGESCPVCEKCAVVGFEGEHGDEGGYEVNSSEVSELLEIEEKILSCSIPHASGRTNLKTHVPAKSLLFGAFTGRG